MNLDQKETPKTHSNKTLTRLQMKQLMEAVAAFKSEAYEGYDQGSLDDLIELEETYRPDPYYLDNAKGLEIRWDMRAILIDWMIEVAHDYKLKISTLQMAINFLDRYSEVSGSKLKKNIY